MVVVGILIGAAFGRVWLSMAAEGLRAWRPAIEVTGWVVLGIFAVAGVFVALRVFRAPLELGGTRPRRAWTVWLGVVIVAEVALIGPGGDLLRGSLGHPEWVPVWTLFVVGVHFSPFALIFRLGAFHRLACAMCAAALVSALAASLAGVAPLWSVLPGLGGAATLWGFAGWALYRMARGRWRLAAARDPRVRPPTGAARFTIYDE